MSASKEFYETLTKDEELRAEAEQAAYAALVALLKERGLEREASKAVEAAVEKVAEAHGFAPKGDEALDLDELDAVSGGKCGCPAVGGGTGTGKHCGCVLGGYGKNDSGDICACGVVGAGRDDE